jgi:hypothetical protein
METTKYQELKNLIKRNAEFTRILKNHRRTVRFQGERLKSFEAHMEMAQSPGTYKMEDKGYSLVNKELTPSLAAAILRGGYSYYGEDKIYRRILDPSAENAFLYTVYGLLRNERKTKKVKVWEDLRNSPDYESYWKKHVDEWRDEEAVRADQAKS